MGTWQLQEAKARFSEVIKRAAKEGPQGITVRGQPAAVVVSEDEFKRLGRRKPRFVDLMRRSPLVGVELDLEREQTPVRRVNLG